MSFSVCGVLKSDAAVDELIYENPCYSAAVGKPVSWEYILVTFCFSSKPQWNYNLLTCIQIFFWEHKEKNNEPLAALFHPDNLIVS